MKKFSLDNRQQNASNKVLVYFKKIAQDNRMSKVEFKTFLEKRYHDGLEWPKRY